MNANTDNSMGWLEQVDELLDELEHPILEELMLLNIERQLTKEILETRKDVPGKLGELAAVMLSIRVRRAQHRREEYQ